MRSKNALLEREYYKPDWLVCLQIKIRNPSMSNFFVGIPQDDASLFVNLANVCYADYRQTTHETTLVLTFPDGFKVEVRDQQANEITALFADMSSK